MANKIDQYLYKDGIQLIAKKDLKIIISKDMFDNGLAEEVDSNISTYGLFRIHSIDDKDQFTVKFPLAIKLNVLERESDGESVTLFYKTNDIIVEQQYFVGHVKSADRFMKYFTSARIPVDNFEDLLKLFIQNMSFNGVSLNVPSELLEAMISEMVRYKDDLTMPFRMAIDKKGVSPTDYTLINIKDIGRNRSVFGALSFEDVKKSLQAGVYLSRTKSMDNVSPVDDLIDLA